MEFATEFREIIRSLGTRIDAIFVLFICFVFLIFFYYSYQLLFGIEYLVCE